MDLDYQSDLAINKHALDQELLDQAQRMFRYSSVHAQAMLNRDKAKQGLDITKANLVQSIRTKAIADGEKMGVGGVTDAVIDARLRSSPTYIQAQESYQQAGHEVNLIFGAVLAMNARRSMLENLVKLFLGQYWSEPRLEGRSLAADLAQDATEQAILHGQQFRADPPVSHPKPPPPPIPMRPTPRAPLTAKE